MKLPINVVYGLLMNASEITSIINPDMIFKLYVPEEYHQIEHLPIVRINEISDYQEGFASDMPFSFVCSVQVDVWASTSKTLEQIQTVMDKLMAQNEWAQYSGGIDSDPDFNNTPRMYRRYRTTQQIDFN